MIFNRAFTTIIIYSDCYIEEYNNKLQSSRWPVDQGTSDLNDSNILDYLLAINPVGNH